MKQTKKASPTPLPYFGISPFGATPSPLQLEHLKMGKKAFFHFGVNTFSGKEWGDGSEKEKLFSPTDCDVREWIRDIKSAGFKLAIITAKHHDGFCLWPSKYTEHSVKNSPYKNGKGDIIKEFTDACREYGIKAGIYISPWDRNSPYWGTDDYSIYFKKQLEELLTGYGRIDEVWWDGAGSAETRYDWGLWAYTVKTLQPTAVIFGSMGATPYIDMRWGGNEAGYAGKTHYASINEDKIYVENVDFLNTGELLGERYIPAEVDTSIRPGWFYHEDQDALCKTAKELDELWFASCGRGAIELLNFPPDRRGRLIKSDVENAVISNRRIEKMLSVNLLSGAKLTADTTYSDLTEIYKATTADFDLFYASLESTAVIDITLPDSTPSYNVLMLSEVVELGERIVSFTLESLDNGTELLASGSSVGFLKAVRFPLTDAKHLRLSLKGATAPVTLRTLSLNLYDSEGDESAAEKSKKNLAALPSSQIILSDDKSQAQVMFGGIFPFDTVSFTVHHHGGEYKISAFDGSKFYGIAEGNAEKYRITLKLDEPVLCYQIKIEYTKKLATDPEFSVF